MAHSSLNLVSPHSEGALDSQKRALRQFCLASRKAAHRHDIEQNGAARHALKAHFLQSGLAPPSSAIIGFYCAMGSEIDPALLMARLDAMGHICVLPVIVDDGLIFRHWTRATNMVKSALATDEPPSSAAQFSPDIIFAPLLGFDMKGTRLGRGGGYYDRAQAKYKARYIGLSYAQQQQEAIPRGAHDVPLDAVITEAGVYIFTESLKHSIKAKAR